MVLGCLLYKSGLPLLLSSVDSSLSADSSSSELLDEGKMVKELKLKIANAPTNIMVSQKEAKDSLKMFYVLLASAIVSAIILVCVNQFVPHEYEVDYVNFRKEKVKQKVTSNSWWWSMFILFWVFVVGICLSFGGIIRQKLEVEALHKTFFYQNGKANYNHSVLVLRHLKKINLKKYLSIK